MPETPQEKRRELLLNDYNNLRDDERTFSQVLAAFFTIGTAVLGAFFVLAKDLSESHTVAAYPDSLIAAAPLVAIAFLTYGQYVGGQAVLRSFYLRELEQELRRMLTVESRAIDNSIPASRRSRTQNRIQAMCWTEMQTSYTSLSGHRQGSFGSFLLLSGMVLFILVFGGLTMYLASKVAVFWSILMLAVYFPIAIMLVSEVYRTIRRGHSFFDEIVGHTNTAIANRRSARNRQPVTNKRGRSVLSYLLLPRPDDMVMKPLFTLSGIALGLYTAQTSRQSLAAVCIAFGCIELLAYQARYQWNDVRGVMEDSLAPSAVTRGRLPGGERNIGRSLAIIGLRIWWCGWLAFILAQIMHQTASAKAAILSIPLVFGVAIIYEAVRWRIRVQGCSKRWLRLVLLTVPLGYPLRFVLGWIATGAPIHLRYMIPLVVGLILLGVLFVSLMWTLECFSYVKNVKHSKHNTVFWAIDTLRPKEHLRMTAGLYGIDVHIMSEEQPDTIAKIQGKHYRPLLLAARTAFWNTPAAGWLILAPYALWGLLTSRTPSGLWLMTGVLVVLGGWIVGRTTVSLWPLLATSVIVSGIEVIFGLQHQVPLWMVVCTVICCLLPYGLTLMFRQLSYDKSRNIANKIAAVLAAAARQLYNLLIGRTA